MSQLGLHLTSLCSKHLSMELQIPTQRSKSLTRHSRQPHQRQKSSRLLLTVDQENIKENQLNCMFLRRKENLKSISEANRNIYIRIQSQKSQYQIARLNEDYQKKFKISKLRRKCKNKSTELPVTARPKSCVPTPRVPLGNLDRNLEQLDREIRMKEEEILQALKF